MVIQFEDIMREHMDYSDMETVHMIAEAKSSAQQNQMMVALTSQLYDLIMDKVNDIDYTSISRSRGDITKIQNYQQLRECLDIITKLVNEYKQDPSPVNIVNDAMNNVMERTAQFKKAFVINSPVPVMLYNNIVAAIVSGVGLMIDTCLEYVKNPASSGFEIALNVVSYKKSQSALFFTSLESFNAACHNGDIDMVLKHCLTQSKVKREAAEYASDVPVHYDNPFMSDAQIQGRPESEPDSYEEPDDYDDFDDDDDDSYQPPVAVAPDDDACCSQKVVVHDTDDVQSEAVIFDLIGAVAGKALMTLCKVVIPIIRHLVYFFFFTKQRISDYYASQAELLEANAYQLQYNTTIDEHDRETIFNKQMKIAAKMRKKANRFSVDYTSSRKKAEALESQEAQKFTADDLNVDPDPHASVSNSVLF